VSVSKYISKSSGLISTFLLTSLPLSIYHKDVFRNGPEIPKLGICGLLPDKEDTNPVKNLEEDLEVFLENYDGTSLVERSHLTEEL
tara:strand:+ start:130 stop:387 length:258 start_codon:yes stop_codon:yes gene_type:complete